VSAVTAALRTIGASFTLQVALARRSPEQLLILVTAPLFSIIFLSLAISNHRPDVIANAVLAPGLIGLWAVALDLAASVIGGDRWEGRFELMMASLSPLSLVIFGRVLVVVLAGALTFGESWLVATLIFRVDVPMADPWMFLLGIVLTGFAVAGTTTLLAAGFVYSRALHVFQNALSYPFYILGGVLVPVAFLPGWLSPISRVFFLSWSADLLRGAMRGTVPSDWPLRAGVVVLLGGVALAVAVVLINRVADRSRRLATVGEA
jgi:ABC-2 type transport system permease protein